MNICYFGTYDRFIHRNSTIIKGLRDNYVNVLEINEPVWKSTLEKVSATRKGISVSLLYRYLTCYVKLSYRYLLAPEHDAIIVGYSGQVDMFLAKALSIIRRKPVILDAFLSLYDAAVNDRQIIARRSPLAKILFFFDKFSCKLADRVYLDTEEHINYFREEFSIDTRKFIAVPTGADQDIFRPRKQWGNKENYPLHVIYFGSYIPLQGVEYIIEAATLLKDNPAFMFTLIGSGQLFPKIRKVVQKRNLNNVRFLGAMSSNDLANEIAKSDIALGIFGLTAKMPRVVPFKVYESLAVGLPVITGDSPAVRRYFKDGEHMLLVPPGSGDAIKSGLIRLLKDPVLREKIAKGGHRLFTKRFNTIAIGKIVKESTEKLLAESY